MAPTRLFLRFGLQMEAAVAEFDEVASNMDEMADLVLMDLRLAVMNVLRGSPRSITVPVTGTCTARTAVKAFHLLGMFKPLNTRKNCHWYIDVVTKKAARFLLDLEVRPPLIRASISSVFSRAACVK